MSIKSEWVWYNCHQLFPSNDREVIATAGTFFWIARTTKCWVNSWDGQKIRARISFWSEIVAPLLQEDL